MTHSLARYARAPLTEATIEYRLKDELSLKELENIRRRFSRWKWSEEQLHDFEFVVGVDGKPRVTLSGYKLTSPEGDAVLQFNKTGGIGLSLLAPYPGWEAFQVRLADVYALWRKEVGSRPIARIGVRYINRFDIPFAQGERVEIPNYMAFTMTEPAILDEPVRLYSIQVNTGISQDRLAVNLASAVVPLPLIDHFSIVLDIDVAREVDVPQRDDDIRKFLDIIRQRRTEIFESCIKDPLRALIS